MERQTGELEDIFIREKEIIVSELGRCPTAGPPGNSETNLENFHC